MDSVKEPLNCAVVLRAGLVSILVLLDSVKEPDRLAGVLLKKQKVSILVLLDSVKELKLSDHKRLAEICFNPCFIG